MVVAKVHIYQDEVTGKIDTSSMVFFVEGNYSRFRNEFYKAHFAGFSNIDGTERWMSSEGGIIYFKY